MTSALQQEVCANCFHPAENHGGICNGSLTCLCQKFIPPYLNRFAQRVEQEKAIRKSVKKRCQFILEKIPQTRNAGEKRFARIYKEIWHGVKIRKSLDKSTIVNDALWKEIPVDDYINREKRRCKQWHEELRTYSPEVVMEQTAIYQALLEMAIEE